MKTYDEKKEKPSVKKNITFTESAVNKALEHHDNFTEIVRDALDYYLIKLNEERDKIKKESKK